MKQILKRLKRLKQCPAVILIVSACLVFADTGEELYFPNLVEWQLPVLVTQQEKRSFLADIASWPVQGLSRGCGGSMNQKATLTNGRKVCILNRETSYKSRNELLYFLLADYLKIHNLPFFKPLIFDGNDFQWQMVQDDPHLVDWTNGDHLLIVQYIDDLLPVYFPEIIWSNQTISANSLHSLSSISSTEMAQWSDLIILDYLSGDPDRLLNALQSSRTNRHIKENDINNLLRIDPGTLVFLDGDLAFQHGYEIVRKFPDDREMQYRFLNNLCLFRRPVIDKILFLSRQNDPIETFLEAADISSQTRAWLSMLPGRDKTEFRHRLDVVLNQLKQCADGHRP